MGNIELAIAFITEQKAKGNIKPELADRWINQIKEGARLRALSAALTTNDLPQIQQIIGDFKLTSFMPPSPFSNEEDKKTYLLYLETFAKIRTPRVIFLLLQAGFPLVIIRTIFNINGQDLEHNCLLNMIPNLGPQGLKEIKYRIAERDSRFNVFWQHFYRKNMIANLRLMSKYFLESFYTAENPVDKIVITGFAIGFILNMILPGYKTWTESLLRSKWVGFSLNFNVLLSGEFNKMIRHSGDKRAANDLQDSKRNLAVYAQILRIPLFYGLQALIANSVDKNLAKSGDIRLHLACCILLSYSFIYSHFVIPLLTFVEQYSRVKQFCSFDYAAARKNLALECKPQRPIVYLYKCGSNSENPGTYQEIDSVQLNEVYFSRQLTLP